MCIVIESFETCPHADLKNAPMVLPFVLQLFIDFFKDSELTVQTHRKPTYNLFSFEKGYQSKPTTKTSMASLFRSYVIETF